MITASSGKENGESALISCFLFTNQRNDTNYSYSSYEDLVAQMNEYFTLKGLAPCWKNVQPFANVPIGTSLPFHPNYSRRHSYLRPDLCNSLCTLRLSLRVQMQDHGGFSQWKTFFIHLQKQSNALFNLTLIWYKNIFEKQRWTLY